MITYLARRAVMSLVTLWVIITLTFVLMHAVPGDPFTSDARVSPQAMANLRAYYGLDQPLVVQYARYLGRLVRLDLGRSIKSEVRDINRMIADGLPVSALLGLEALLLAVTAGVALGIVAALGHDRGLDYLSMGVAIIGISVPSFILATLLIHLLAVKLEVLPVGTWGTWRHTVMPALALALAPLAYVARLVRSSMLDELSQDYVKAALARGLPRSRVILGHALRNALLPVATVLGPLTAGVLTGSFVIENIFAIPGIGKLFVLSISDRDYPLILSGAVVYSVLLLAMNLLVDLTYGILDPRIRIAGRRLR
ncbi:MAG: peptide ABC transporter permease [Armatimonadetes bacterium RBG_16_67_12]|nr:MAG: peptide ABC transporter permease [Armatimonadetes bacterium RBG_16_67_12]